MLVFSVERVETTLRTRLGTALRAQREHWNLSQEKLAERVGFTPRYYAGLERGERNISLDTLDEVARILGLDPVALLAGQKVDRRPDPRAAPADANPVKRNANRKATAASG